MWLVVACRSVFAGVCGSSLLVVCCLVFVVRCLLFVVCCFVVWGWLTVVLRRLLLFRVCCLVLFVV